MALFLEPDLRLKVDARGSEVAGRSPACVGAGPFPPTSTVYLDSVVQRVDSHLGACPVLLGVALLLRSGI